MHHPDHFPITWRHPTDANLFWSQDRLHFPEPVTPLEFSFIEGAVDAGISKAARQYDIPITVLDRHINGYVYFCVQPDELAVDVAAALAKQAEAKLGSAMDNLLTLWQTHWLPEIQGHLAVWEQYPLSTAALSDLSQHLNDAEERMKRVWEIHFLLFLPSMVAISRFADLYNDLLKPTAAQAAYALLTGFDTKTIQSAEALWALSRQLLASPTLAACFRQHAADQILPLLTASPTAATFLADFQRYLRIHGYRSDKLSLSQPFWIEDPTPVIKNLQAYIQQPARAWLDRQQMAAQRQQAVGAFYQQLAHYPQPVQAEATRLLQAAQAGAFLKEEHGYWLDFQCMYRLREILLAIGQRLTAAQMIAKRDEIFYLQLDEVKRLLAGGASALPTARTLIAERQSWVARFADCTPPPALGTIPDGPPPADLLARMFSKIEGDAPPPPKQVDELRGHAAARGVVRGPVKVVRMLQEAGKVKPGDILVAETTSPSWTLLFGTIGGLITNSGGILSHSAVVAREYGIPAVVGVGNATHHLRDGQRVEVDGNQGVIRILAA